MNLRIFPVFLHVLHLFLLGGLGIWAWQRLQDRQAEQRLAEGMDSSFRLAAIPLEADAESMFEVTTTTYNAYRSIYTERYYQQFLQTYQMLNRVFVQLGNPAEADGSRAQVLQLLRDSLAAGVAFDTVFCRQFTALLHGPGLDQPVLQARPAQQDLFRHISRQNAGLASLIALNRLVQRGCIDIVFDSYEPVLAPDILCPTAGDSLVGQVLLAKSRYKRPQHYATVWLNGRRLPGRHNPFPFSLRIDSPGRHEVSLRAEVFQQSHRRRVEKTISLNVR
ncbi:MAG: hypothetical protein IT260_00015 [Saprospiraceae bacterium]|nr:hypothetical protein [Saprospiraceae bacterium]